MIYSPVLCTHRSFYRFDRDIGTITIAGTNGSMRLISSDSWKEFVRIADCKNELGAIIFGFLPP